MKILCLVLVVLSVTCYSPNQKSFLAEISNFEEKFSDVLYSLVQLEREVGTPVEELMLAIEQFLQETTKSKEKEDANFARVTSEHLDYKQLLEGNIQQTTFAIQSATNKLENILEPKTEQLQESIDQRNTNIENSMQTFQEEQTMREGETKKFNLDLENYNMGIAIAQECIEQMNVMQNTKDTSFVQLNKTKLNLHKLEKEVFQENNEFSPMIMALLQLLDNQSWGDQVMDEAMQKLGDLENIIRDSKGIAGESEEKKSQMWDERSAQIKKEILDMQNANDYDQQDLDAVKDNIQSETSLINEQKGTLTRLTDTLKKEEDDFYKQQQVHDELIGKYEADMGLTVEAKQLILIHKDELESLAKQHA